MSGTGSAVHSSSTPIGSSGGIRPLHSINGTSGTDAQQVWKNTGTDFNSGSSWVSGTAPGAGDVAAFSGAKATNPNLSASSSISGLYFSGTGTSGYTLSATSPNTLTLTGFATSIGAETGDSNAVAIGAENTSGTNTISAPIILAPASGSTSTISQASGGTLNITGNTSGSGINLSLTGGGSFQLSGANTYSGGTTLSAGTLNINNAGSGGTSSAIGTGTFTINGGTIDNTSAGAITLSTNNAVTWGGDFAFGGTKDLNLGTGAVTMGASRTITLGGTNSTLTFGGTLTNTTFNPTLTVNGSGNTLSLGGVALGNTSVVRTVTVTGTSNVNITGPIVNGGTATGGNLTFTGTGTLLLSGANTFGGFSGGSVTIGSTGGANAGTLRLSGSGTLGATTNTLLIRGGTLDLNGTSQTILTLGLGGGAAGSSANITLGGGTLNLGGDVTYTNTNNPNGATISGSGAVNLNGTRTFLIGDSTNAAVDLTISSVIANGSTTSGFKKQSSGTMVLSGAGSNTYTGTTTVVTGEMDLNKTGGATAISGNTVIVSNGGTLKWASGTTNEVTTGASITISSNGTVNLNGATQTVVDLTNSGGTFMTGAGSWTGTGASMTWGASSVANTINAGGSVSDIHVTISGGNNTIEAGGALAGGTLIISPAGMGLEMNGGTVTLNADATDPTKSGNISLMSDVKADDGTTSTIATSSQTNPGFINLNGAPRTFNVGPGNVSTTLNISASIQGTNGGLTKAGLGTLNLTGNNTYIGATTINANGGTLNAGAAGALGGTSSVTANSGGTVLLSGSGNLNRVNDSAGINLNGGTFKLGRSGSETVSEGVGATRNGAIVTGTSSVGLGALTLNSTSNLDFGTGGVGTLVFASFTPNANVLNILDYTNSHANPTTNTSGSDGVDDRLIFHQDQSGNLADFNFGSGLTAAEIALDSGFFEIVAVPEPDTWVAAALALGAVGFAQRRRSLRFNSSPIKPLLTSRSPLIRAAAVPILNGHRHN